ncbi:MAG: carbon-phosphorus lyase complex subunit PhnI [Caulobacterales bacterium]
MAYVSVKGGERAIEAAHALLAEERRGDASVAELGVDQVREQLSLAVDRVMAEGSCYDRDLAALAVKQARGDLPEAVFLLRAYRTTLPRFGFSAPVDTAAMHVRRRISAAFKDIPGGQVLGPTFDYTHRLLDFRLAAEGLPPRAPIADAPLPHPMPTVAATLSHEDLLAPEPAAADAAPYDLTREPMRFPAGRDQRLQALARGDEGFLLSLAYASQRGWGSTHPLCGEIRMGEVAVSIVPEELGFPIEIGDLVVTECMMISSFEGSAERPPQFTRGYGLSFGCNERKAMSMAIVDRALSQGAEAGEAGHAVQDEEFVLYHSDNVEASGFVQHLKLPHYVDFQAELQFVRTLRKEWYALRAAAPAPQMEPA